MEERIDTWVKELEKNGSTFDLEQLKEIRSFIKQEIKKDQGIEECLLDLAMEIKQAASSFLYHTEEVISGLSSCIYLPDINGTYSLTVLGGKTRYSEKGKEVSERTVFDLASVTKLYTFILALKLIEEGYFKRTDKIKDLDSRFSNLEDYTIEDILKMSGEIRTNGRVTEGKNEEEAFHFLETTYIYNSDRKVNHYTDIGFIILSKLIEKRVSEGLGKSYSFDQIMKKYLLEPWGLSETMFYPDSNMYDIAGNGNVDSLVHDPKARLLGGAVGSAGLFASVEGIKKLSDRLFLVENVNYTKLMGTIIYPTTSQSNKGYAGIYQKYPFGLKKTFVPNEYATGSFAHQGFSGATAVFDPKNKFMNTILVNAIKEGEAKKPDGYLNAFGAYQSILTKSTLKAYLLHQYYKTIGYQESVEIKTRTY